MNFDQIEDKMSKYYKLPFKKDREFRGQRVSGTEFRGQSFGDRVSGTEFRGQSFGDSLPNYFIFEFREFRGQFT